MKIEDAKIGLKVKVINPFTDEVYCGKIVSNIFIDSNNWKAIVIDFSNSLYPKPLLHNGDFNKNIKEIIENYKNEKIYRFYYKLILGEWTGAEEWTGDIGYLKIDEKIKLKDLIDE